MATHLSSLRASLVAGMVKNLLTMWEAQVLPLEKGMATTLVFLPGEFHEQRSLGGYSPWGLKESDTTEGLRCRNREQTCGHSRGRRGWDKSSSTDIYTSPCVKQPAGSGRMEQGAQLNAL